MYQLDLHPNYCFDCSINDIIFSICSNGWLYWLVNAIGLLILLFFLTITWFKKLWILFQPINEDDPNVITLPEHRFFRYLFNVSNRIIQNAPARIIIYFISICVLVLSALIHLVNT